MTPHRRANGFYHRRCPMKRLFKSRALCSILPVLPAASFAAPQTPPPAGTQHPLTELLNAVKEMGDRVENIDILSRYCKPPMQPDKSGAEIDIGLESLLFRRLLRDFYRIEQSFTSGGSSPEASSYRASFPVIDGIIATDQNDGAKYWPAVKQKLTQVQNLLAKKRRARMPPRRALIERRCRGAARRTRIKAATRRSKSGSTARSAGRMRTQRNKNEGEGC